jgi:di/tricarboxylate transporter
MTIEIAVLFAVLATMVLLFLSERLPIDLTAFLGLVALIFLGYVAPEQAFQGFASSAVITMMSIFVISTALMRTGVSDALGRGIHRLAGSREVPLIATVMLVAGGLSAFMPNIAATAVMMPAVASLGRQAGLSPSRMFMPLSFGAILGGTTTLVGTPPNILAGELLVANELNSFSLFGFAPVGIVLLLVGTLYMLSVGRHLLPSPAIDSRTERATNLAELYRMQDSLFRFKIPKASRLDGVTLEEARLGTTLDLQIVSISRASGIPLALTADTVLRADDELLVQGALEDLREKLDISQIELEDPQTTDLKPPPGISAIDARIPVNSWFVGKCLSELDLDTRFGVSVVAIERDEEWYQDDLGELMLMAGDRILGLGTDIGLESLAVLPDIEVLQQGVSVLREISDAPLFVLRIPQSSPLVGQSVARSSVGELTGLTVVAVVRGEAGPEPVLNDRLIEAGDRLLVAGEKARVTGLMALGDVRLETEVGSEGLLSEDVHVFEATVAPRSRAGGRTLAELDFRGRYELQVLGIWRQGTPIREGLANLALHEGDALLLQGSGDKVQRLTESADYIVLDDIAHPPRRPRKAPYAIGALAVMIAIVVSGWQPIAVAAFAAATLVVLSGAITMGEARHAIEWRTIFLVAAVLPVGSAMQESGAAAFLARGVVDLAGPHGPYAVLAALAVLSSLLSQGLDGAPAVVLLSPVVVQAAERLGVSPYPLMMGVSLSASAAFMTPFGHKANLLVMGLGGYRSTDYLRVGTPLTLLLLVIVIFLVPAVFPF